MARREIHPKAQHGGKRPGAGRKPNAAEIGLLIGGECEAEYRRRHSAKLLEARKHTLSPDVTAAYEQIKSHQKRFMDYKPPRERTPKAVAKLDSAGRWVTFTVSRSKDFRWEICTEVARRNGLSPHTVDRHWKAFRRFQKSVVAQT